MKEISYIHAEGYAAGEIKHGPFALLSEHTPVIAICPLVVMFYGVMTSNNGEMKARGTPLIILGEKDDRDPEEISDVFIPLPWAGSVAGLLSATVILQPPAHHTANALSGISTSHETLQRVLRLNEENRNTFDDSVSEKASKK